MRTLPALAVGVLLCACGPRAEADGMHPVRDESPDLVVRAESLRRLDPVKEATSAIARGDLRYVAVCGYACVPVGIDLNGVGATGLDSLRWIEGTTDAVANDDVAELNIAAATYATAYNRVIEAERAQRARRAP